MQSYNHWLRLDTLRLAFLTTIVHVHCPDAGLVHEPVDEKLDNCRNNLILVMISSIGEYNQREQRRGLDIDFCSAPSFLSAKTPDLHVPMGREMYLWMDIMAK